VPATWSVPRCGRLLAFGTGRSGGCRWDKRTNRIECFECGLVLMLGLLAWPIRRGAAFLTPPRDQVPQERQLAQLRAITALGPVGAGWWMPEHMRKPRWRMDDTNITAACTCQPGTENTTAQDPNCPIHGGA
jgi:hypothetical protein